jgi:hypothetical protein
MPANRQSGEVARNLEEFRAGFGLLFPVIGQQAPPPITVVVFKDDGSFRPFKTCVTKASRQSSRGTSNLVRM